MITIGIIGVGGWGINHFRTLTELENCSVKWICARKHNTVKKALSIVKPRYSVKTTIDYKEILKDKGITSVVISTNGSAHYQLTKESLNANKNVLVEKPLCFTSSNAKELISLSNQRKKILMIGHIHLYNPPIKKLKEDIKSGLFGKIHYIQSMGTGNGPIRKDMNVVWDIFPHDVSILSYLLEQYPLKVSAKGASYIKEGIEDMAIMNLSYPKNINATAFASWLYPLKKREVIVVGEKLYAVFDDYSQEKLRYYDSRIYPNGNKNKSEYTVLKFSNEKPLTQELMHFLDCIENNKQPLTDCVEALQVTKILEKAAESIKGGGILINL